MAILQRLYDRLPSPIQTLAINAYGLKLQRERFGSEFRSIMAELAETERCSAAQIEEYQAVQLGRMVKHAYDTVPYYHRLMTSLKLKPADIRTPADLVKLPILTKDDIRTNFSELKSRAVPSGRMAIGRTSGTSGSPLTIMWDRHMQIFNNAVDWRQKVWAGVPPGSKVALVLGRPIVDIKRTRPPFWQENLVQNQLWLSSFHLSPGNFELYFKQLERFKPDALEGYPSTLHALALLFREAGKSLPLKAVFSSSEPLHDFQREIITSAFSCKIYDYYGSAERVLFATQCGMHDAQHVNFEYGVTELVDERGDVVSQCGQTGAIVATSLQNFGIPLLRYRLNDKTTFLPETCMCGREMPLMQRVDTKYEDCIRRRDGTVISPSILTHPFKPISTIVKSQIIQRTETSIEILIIKREGYDKGDERALLMEFCKRVGDEFIVTVRYVDEIASDPSGKFRWVVNQVQRKPIAE